MADSPRTVIVFGLSANPPTGLRGHAGLVAWAVERADEVWVLPVYRHAFHEKRELAPWEDRVEMARLAFEHLPGAGGRVRVLELERTLAERLPAGERLGTIDVMRALIAAHPEVHFELLLGADTFRDLARGRWKESAALLALVPLRVVAREGAPLEPELEGRTERVPGLGEVSSSQVRASRDVTALREVLQPEVLEHILKRRLYAFADPPT